MYLLYAIVYQLRLVVPWQRVTNGLHEKFPKEGGDSTMPVPLWYPSKLTTGRLGLVMAS